MRESEDGEITIFLSYARADDKVYKMVRHFKELLIHFVHAKSGRKVKAFFDQDDLRWGDIWENELETRILGASVFIPMLSASYLDSENCRWEFNRFHSNASALGVRELILPVLLLNAPAIFNRNSDDELVRDAAARQWEVIEDAVLSDPGTSAWKVTMAHLADRFVDSYAAAEARLATLDGADLQPVKPANEAGDHHASDDADGDGDLDDDGPVLAELMESIQNNVNRVTSIASSLTPTVQQLGEAARQSNQGSRPQTPQQLQAWSRRAAGAFEEPANALASQGEEMLNVTKALDVDMRRVRQLTKSLLPETAYARGYNELIAPLQGMGTVRDQLTSLLDSLKPAEVISVPLRKALRPARNGVTRVTDSLDLMESWQPIDLDG